MKFFDLSVSTGFVSQGYFQAALKLLGFSLLLSISSIIFSQPYVKYSQMEVLVAETSKKTSLNLPEVRLTSVEVLAMHLSLANKYAAEKKFELAYLEKQQYLERYRVFRKNKRNEMTTALTKTYEIDDKTTLNELLKSENELKLLWVAEVQQDKQDQQYHFILIVSVLFVFILLLFRELKVRNKLVQLASIDPLTSLANRNTLFQHGQKFANKFITKPFDFSVLLLDLDHFKEVNDTYGHQVGDQVLIVVANLVNETMRSRDVLARLGGEEFVALLPFADVNAAKAIAMRINEKIANYDFSATGCKSNITLSIGVAAMQNEDMNFDGLLHSADLAMYQAKKQGRNRIISYQNIESMQERRGI